MPRRPSSLFAFPTGNNTVSESYLSEDVTWSRFIKIACTEMHLREGCVPELKWKFSNGTGSKSWIKLSDGYSYDRMVKAGAKRIRDRAQKESNIKDPDLASGWRIDLEVMNEVQRIEDEDDKEEVEVEAGGKKEKEKSKKKGSKAKGTKRQKRNEQKKVTTSPDQRLVIVTDMRFIFSPEKSRSVSGMS